MKGPLIFEDHLAGCIGLSCTKPTRTCTDSLQAEAAAAAVQPVELCCSFKVLCVCVVQEAVTCACVQTSMYNRLFGVLSVALVEQNLSFDTRTAGAGSGQP